MIRLRFVLVLLLAALAPAAGRSAGPLNTLVVVNRASRDSRALGRYYADRHGIPDTHICSVKTSARAASLSLSRFDRDIRQPIRDHIRRNRLEGQIHFLVLCMDLPSRVNNYNGLTAALFYGYHPADPDAPRCHIASNTVNQYFGAETAYTSTAGWNRTNAPIAFLLTADNLETAKRIVDRAVESQAEAPAGRFCLYGSPDAARNIRHPTYAGVARLFELFGMADRVTVNPGADPVPGFPVLGLMTGRGYLPPAYTNLVLAPGAVAEHLTSCAGMVPDPCMNQSTVWDWMRLGATASYGTVSEPCSFREKFPDPMLFFWYARGFTAGEALAMSVRNPYQGIWVGDPLAAPFAAPPSVQVLSPAANATLSGETLLELALESRPDGAPPVFLDLYLDGRHHAPVIRPIAPVGNDLVLSVGSNRFEYTIAPGEDLFAAVAGLAWAVNAGGKGRITASARADRLELTVRDPLDSDGIPLPVAASVEQGFAKARYIDGRARTERLVAADGVGRAAAAFHLGSARSYRIEYPLDLTGTEPGLHTLSFVVRDGTAMQCRSRTDLPVRIAEPE